MGGKNTHSSGVSGVVNDESDMLMSCALVPIGTLARLMVSPVFPPGSMMTPNGVTTLPEGTAPFPAPSSSMSWASEYCTRGETCNE